MHGATDTDEKRSGGRNVAWSRDLDYTLKGPCLTFVLEHILGNVQRVMEKALAAITLSDVMDEIHSRQQLRR